MKYNSFCIMAFYFWNNYGENFLNFHNRFNICKTYYNMQHRKDGNFVIVKLDEGEDIIKSLEKVLAEENIKNGFIRQFQHIYLLPLKKGLVD